MICSVCGALNEDGSDYCGKCGAAMNAGSQAAVVPLDPVDEAAEVVEIAAEPDTQVQASVPDETVVAEKLPVVPPAIEAGRTTGTDQRAPEGAGTSGPAVAVRNQKPESAFLIEFLAGIFGFLGIGYMYAAKTNDGVVRLVVWLVYTILAWVVIGLLTSTLIGIVFTVICVPVQLVLQIGVPLWSANRLKKQLMAEA